LSTHCRFTREAEVRLHSFLTSALDGSAWSASRPGYINPRQETWYRVTSWWLGKPQSWSGYNGEDNLLPLQGFEPRIFQPLA